MKGKVIITLILFLLVSCENKKTYTSVNQFNGNEEISVIFLDKTTVICPTEKSGEMSLEINGEIIADEEGYFYLDSDEIIQGKCNSKEIISNSGEVIYMILKKNKYELILYSLKSKEEYFFYCK